MDIPKDVTDAAWRIIEQHFVKHDARIGSGFSTDTAEIASWIEQAILVERERCAKIAGKFYDRGMLGDDMDEMISIMSGK